MAETMEHKIETAIIGGTFDAMHIGHMEYIKLAFKKGHKVYVFLTTDSYASKVKSYPVKPFSERKKLLEYFIETNFHHNYELLPLNSEEELISFCLEMNISVAIICYDYFKLFEKINKARENIGKEKIKIIEKKRTEIIQSELSSTLLRIEEASDPAALGLPNLIFASSIDNINKNSSIEEKK